MSPVFIYALNDPETNMARYIGKSYDPKRRLGVHLRDRAVCHRTNWIKGLAARGLRPVLEIIEETTGDVWEERERYYIRVFREMGFNLVNMTDGGDGLSKGHKPSQESIKKRADKWRGQKHSEETKILMGLSKLGKKRTPFSEECRKRMSESHSGERHILFGKHLSESTKAKISASNSGPKHHLFGKHLSQSTRDKISLANVGRSKNAGANNYFFGKHLPKSTRDKIGNANRGHKHSAEAKLLMSKKAKAWRAKAKLGLL